MRVEVFVDVEVRPTEDPLKVREALEKVYNGEVELDLDQDGIGYLRGRGGLESLTKVRDLLKMEQIRDAAKAHLSKLIEDGRLTFFLNKQVAYVGHISFCEPERESPLGPIRFVVHTDDPKSIVEWLTRT
ncbi:MAG: RNA-binding domain-containing protein [Candidatus Bathyarchaeia archaeon]